MPGIFISYRREDSAGHAGRIFDRLREKFGRDKVFIDVAGIEPGVDFIEAIDRAVGSCDVLLVIIGKKWLTCNDASGKSRLDDPKDFIRLETATALRRDIRVIPVLVQGAAMPGEGDLPDDLKKLARRQATEISDTHWDSDTEQLIETLAKVLPGEPKPAQFGVRGAAHISAPAEEKREIPTPVPVWLGKNRLTWIISTITAVVVALGGLFYINQSNKVAVPNLVGLSLPEAVARVGQEHLKPGTVRPMPESPVNLVLAEKRPVSESEPTTSHEAKPEVVMATVPRLVGQPLEEARLLLEKAGLKPAKAVRKETRDAPEGTVIVQAPRAGTKLTRGKMVELVVAVRPPEPEKTQEPAMVTVPDVTGVDVKRAVAILKDARLSARMERVGTTQAEPGSVLKQSLKPGSQVGINETVLLVYAVAPRDEPANGEIVLPDFTGSPIQKVEAFLREAGLVLGPVHEKVTSEQRPGTVLGQRPPRQDLHGERIESAPAGGGERWRRGRGAPRTGADLA